MSKFTVVLLGAIAALLKVSHSFIPSLGGPVFDPRCVMTDCAKAGLLNLNGYFPFGNGLGAGLSSGMGWGQPAPVQASWGSAPQIPVTPAPVLRQGWSAPVVAPAPVVQQGWSAPVAAPVPVAQNSWGLSGGSFSTMPINVPMPIMSPLNMNIPMPTPNFGALPLPMFMPSFGFGLGGFGGRQQSGWSSTPVVATPPPVQSGWGRK